LNGLYFLEVTMAKDPAFLFYPGDYLRDTQTLSGNSQVAYDRIMCEHMRNICISQKQLKFFTKRLNEDEVDELMFVLTETNGGYHIEWVADSITKRKAYSDSRRKNREGKGNKDMINTSSTYEPHMENENVNENENVIKKGTGKCLMKNSGVTTLDISDAFNKSDDLKKADPKHYFNAAFDWSEAKGEMRKDWVATVRTFARKDVADNKLKIKNTSTASVTNHAIETIPNDYGVVSKTSMTREEFKQLKNK